jgi:uncharacterized protein (DUF433 family)
MVGRRFLIPVVAIVAVAAGGIAGAMVGAPSRSGASSDSTEATAAADEKPQGKGPKGARVDAAAKALGITTDELLERLSDGETTIADVAKERGVALAAVVDAIMEVERAHVEEFVNNPLRKGHRHGGPGFRKGPHGPMFGGHDAAASALGITTDELVDALHEGKTIAEVAKDKGVDVAKVIDAMVAAATEKIDEARENGRIDDERAAALKERVKGLVTDLVNEGHRPDLHEFGPGMPHPDRWDGGAPIPER